MSFSLIVHGEQTQVKPVLGIDVGTACVRAAWTDDTGRTVEPVVSLVPALTMGPSGWLLGDRALEHARVQPDHTVTRWKWLLGRPYESGVARRTAGDAGYDLARGPAGEAWLLVGDDVWSPVDLAAAVLEGLRREVEALAGPAEQGAVFTVPGAFGPAQTAALLEAAQHAGFVPLAVLHETTALALAAVPPTFEGNVAVVDAGAGKLEVALVRARGAAGLEVLARRSEPLQGADALVARLVNLLLADLERATGESLEGDARVREVLRQECEASRRGSLGALGLAVRTPFLEGVGGRGRDANWALPATRVHPALLDLVEEVVVLCDLALADAGLKPTGVDRVVLGGSLSALDELRARVTSEWHRPPTPAHLDDVARGAALFAGMFAASRAGRAVARNVRDNPVPPDPAPAVAPPVAVSAPPPVPPPVASVGPMLPLPPPSAPPVAPPIAPPLTSRVVPPSVSSAPRAPATTLPPPALPRTPVPPPRSVPLTPVPSSHAAPLTPVPPSHTAPLTPVPPSHTAPLTPVPPTHTAPLTPVPPTHTAPLTPVPPSMDPSRSLASSLPPPPPGMSKGLPPPPKAGRFKGVRSSAELVALALGKPPQDEPGTIALPSLLIRLTYYKDLTADLMVSHGGETYPITIYHGAPTMTGLEVSKAQRAFLWGEGQFTLERRSDVVPSPQRPQQPMVAFVVGGLRPVLRAMDDTEIIATLLPRMTQSPVVSEDRRKRVGRLALLAHEARMVEHEFDGERSVEELLQGATASRSTLLRLLVVLEVFDCLTWGQPRGHAQLDPLQVLQRKLERMRVQNHFDALGVHWSVSRDEIDQAWSKLQMDYGPTSKWHALSASAAKGILERGAAAWAVLHDDAQRLRYRRDAYPEIDPELLGPLVESRAKALAMKGEESEAADMRRLLGEINRAGR